MMALVWKYKRGEVWYLEYNRSIGKPTKSLQTKNRQIAEMIRAKEENDLLLSQHGISHKPLQRIRYSEFLRQFVAYKTGQGKSPNTIAAYTFALNNLGEFIGTDQYAHKLTRSNIDSYVAHRFEQGRAVKTIRNELITFITAFRWGKSQGFVTNNPLDNYELPKRIKRPPDYLHEEEYLLLKKLIDDNHFMDILDFYILTGCRREEGILIDPRQHIDIKGGIISIPQPKSGDFRTLPISDELRPVLKRLLKYSDGAGSIISHSENGKQIPYTKAGLTRRFRRIIDRVGLRDSLRFHSLRHTFGTWLGMQGVGQRNIQAAMGHNDAKSTQVYVHAVDHAFKRDIGRLRLPKAKRRGKLRKLPAYYLQSKKKA